MKDILFIKKVKEINDYLLIEKIKKGDTDAWEVLVNKYYNQIYCYCVRRCYGNRSVAADLTQDIFLKLVTSINSFRYSGKFYNYLFTIAVNTCNNYCTKKSLNQTELNDSVFSIDVEKSMIDNIIENENSIIIQKALDTLPDMQREAIILKYYHDFKVKDIAKTTGVSVPTAQSRIQQGLKKLSKLLDRKEFLK